MLTKVILQANIDKVAKYFERIGDHATNIVVWVIFALDDKKIEQKF